MKVANDKIKVTWTCHRCLIDVVVGPEHCELNGVPVCRKCGDDMSYSETEIDLMPRAIMFIEGGVIHDVMSDHPMKLRVVDYDIDGAEDEDVKTIKLPGSSRGEVEYAYVSKYNLKGVEDLAPFFKQKALK